MTMENFKYNDEQHAMHDLLLFSRMNMHEDRPLMLHKLSTGKFVISKYVCKFEATITAVAINGSVFKPE